ncbi:MAG: hypothetical protein ACPIOQ_53465, partial [Promethearchaeia archaeon]
MQRALHLTPGVPRVARYVHCLTHQRLWNDGRDIGARFYPRHTLGGDSFCGFSVALRLLLRTAAPEEAERDSLRWEPPRSKC